MDQPCVGSKFASLDRGGSTHHSEIWNEDVAAANLHRFLRRSGNGDDPRRKAYDEGEPGDTVDVAERAQEERTDWLVLRVGGDDVDQRQQLNIGARIVNYLPKNMVGILRKIVKIVANRRLTQTF